MNARIAGAKFLFFDVGETLVSEERLYASWARWLGVPVGTFFAALGAVIEARRHHREVFQIVRPGLDLAAEAEKRWSAGDDVGFLPTDVYPDTLPTLRWARRVGFKLGFAGNHSEQTEAFVRSLDIEADVIGSSQRWGVEKPSPNFFARIIEETRLAPDEIVYVGDRIDNDILPALAIGMGAIFVERGPWGIVQSRWPEARSVSLRVRSLSELSGLLDPPTPPR